MTGDARPPPAPPAWSPCGSPPANAAGFEQCGPSLFPLQPPNDGTTWPPAALICAIAVASALPCSGRLLSHAGLQPPEALTNAMVNHLTPVAFITVCGFGGFPQPMYRYGAPLPPVPGGG